MEGKRRAWSIRTSPLSFWSVQHQAWCNLELPVRLEPGQDLWLDLDCIVYGMAELHFL